MSTVAMICAAEAREACKNEPDLMERLRKAMKSARGNWMAPPEAEQFRAAVAAAMLESPEPEKDRIQRSAAALNRIDSMMAALAAGVPVDLEKMASEPQDEDLISLRKIWDETA